MDFKQINFKDFDFKKLGKKRNIYSIAAGLLAALLAWAFITAGIITRNFKREQLFGTENRQELNISSIILTETKGDKKYWELYGEKGHYNSDSRIALLENVTGNFYNNKNEVSMSFQSSKGTYNEVKKEITLYENTYIVIKDGTSLRCDKLVWAGTDKDVVATGNIKINRNKQLVSTAEKAVINADYSDFKIIGKTVTKLYDLKEK